VFSTTDTIVAIATPPGRGGIGIVRVSGRDAREIAGKLTALDRPLVPRYATLTRIRVVSTAVKHSGASGWTDAIDEAILTYFPEPHSYTGEDLVEISAHGSPVVLNEIVTAALALGARAAEPGEFTLRAYLNGRIDLTQAEAIADLIDAVTPLQARAAFDQLQGTLTQAIGDIDRALFDIVARLEASVDFPDEGYHFMEPESVGAAIEHVAERTTALLADARRGRLIREGLQIAIVGPPNVGKSSLFNALVGANRAIVTDVPGTTRDLVSETIDLEGLRVTIVDTAGLRETDDVVEHEGVARAQGAAQVADVALYVLDGSRPLTDDVPQHTEYKRLTVSNKSDLPAAWSRDDAIRVSARTGAGVDDLRQEICRAFDVEVTQDRPAITNIRHITLLERARDALLGARAAAVAESLSEEFVLADLQRAREAFEEIVGRRTPDDVLTHIFERFCIGK
jgi:tRNA modification GTPase